MKYIKKQWNFRHWLTPGSHLHPFYGHFLSVLWTTSSSQSQFSVADHRFVQAHVISASETCPNPITHSSPCAALPSRYTESRILRKWIKPRVIIIGCPWHTRLNCPVAHSGKYAKSTHSIIGRKCPFLTTDGYIRIDRKGIRIVSSIGIGLVHSQAPQPRSLSFVGRDPFSPFPEVLSTVLVEEPQICHFVITAWLPPNAWKNPSEPFWPCGLDD